MNKGVQLAKTLAARVPEKANEVLASYGAKQAEGKKLVGQLIALQNKHGEEALKKLMAIHPDSEAIIHYNAPPAVQQSEQKSNCGGCASNMAGKTCPMMNVMSSTEGPQQTQTQTKINIPSFKEWAPFAVGATLFISAVILIAVDKK